MLNLSEDEAAFLLVLLSEEPTVTKRMQELHFPIEKIDIESLISRVRKICWDNIWQKKQELVGQTTPTT